MGNKLSTYKISPRVYLVAGLAVGYFVGQRYNFQLLAKKVDNNNA